MPNRLQHEQSPYLLQHKDNPVDWYPWGEEAFDKAREEDKPVFLSIGYSTCHWCHVMERESFEDEEVARLMNEAFVNIKVDREERPDVDNIYMTVCQMMTGQGGWPLSILLTPDKKPFFAATYLPKQSRFGRMGMVDLIPRIRQAWNSDREQLLDSADALTERLQQMTEHEPTGRALDRDHLDIAFRQLSNRFDKRHGGFGDAPKFPSPHNLLFLLRYWKRTHGQKALEMVTSTLDRMRLGGIYDHLGYGFHRYSTDAEWKLPHFEKMLYDQAMLVTAYTEAYQATQEERYRQTGEEVIEYVFRDMTAPEGGFYSAEDADSEGREGAFYIWTIDEVEEVLDKDTAGLFLRAYNFEEEGNFVEEATRERTDENLLYLKKPLSALADDFGMEEKELTSTLERARENLFSVREQRERPGRDDKILTDWNGLMIAALAKAGRVFDVVSYVDKAEEAVSFILERLRSHHGHLRHRYRNGDAAIRGHLDDYAFLVWGLIELYEATFESRYLQEALELTERAIEEFHDDDLGAFYFYSKEAEQLITRPKEAYDGAIPSGNSIMMWNLIRLGRLTGKEEFDTIAENTSTYFAEPVGQQPLGFTAMLVALETAFFWEHEIVIAGEPEAEDTKSMLDALRQEYLPNSVTLLRPQDPEDPLIELVPFVWEQRPLDGQATAYVCRNYQCEQPTTDPETLMDLVRALEVE